MVQISLKRSGVEMFRLFFEALLLYGLLFVQNSLPFLWPTVFFLSSPALNAVGIANALLAITIFILFQRKSNASFGEFGLSLVLTAVVLRAAVSPFSSALAALLESRGTSFEFLFAAVYVGPPFVVFWVELELIALALGGVFRLLEIGRASCRVRV